jgi:endonuclease YncB( thermonuclease family)
MLKSLLALVITALLTAGAAAETISGKIVGISDGDTLTLLANDRRQVKVRLAEIDTPESGQPYGAQSKRELSDLVFGRQAEVEVQDIDRYGRTVGRVKVGGTDVNVEMVRRGAAWVYRQYLKNRLLLEIEADARARKVGLWALPETQRTAPWDWRAVRRSERPGQGQSTAPLLFPQLNASGPICGVKRTCGQMSDCEEARFYLNRCGVSRLDGDGDGTPCEKICR